MSARRGSPRSPGPRTATALLAALVALVALVVSAVPSRAFAQTFGRDEMSRHESPQNFAFELRFGGYYPMVDSEFGAAPPAGQVDRRPFHVIFGDGIRFLPEVEFDWQILRVPHVLQLGIGGSAGFTSIQGRAPFTPFDPNGATAADPTNATVRSTEVTGLQVVPTALMAIVRVDGPSRATRYFPIVPYAKFGIAWTPWWVTNASGYAYVPADDGPPGTDGMPVHRNAGGAAFGLRMAVGLMLNLGVFEPHVQRQFDATIGVNHSYLFGEIYYTSMFGAALGGTPQLDLSALAWTLGIALEF